MDITITRKKLVLLILAIVAGTAVLTASITYYGFKAPATSVPVSAPAPVDHDGSSAAELVPGAGDDPYADDDEFRCKAGFIAVQVPIGKTMQVDGAEYVVAETNPARAGYVDQESVIVTIKLAANVSAPTLIVNTAAHIKRPDLYSQHLIQIDLAAGGSGSYTLRTRAYAENYETVGITDITICTKTSK